MTFRNLLVEDAGAVRRITLNRPDKLNALNHDTLSELHQAFAAAAADDGVRVVVLTGAGPKAFVAGADIAEMNGLGPAQARDFSRHGQQLMSRIEQLGKPVIAMVNGFALGGGLELAMACHLRLAADTAKVGQPEINLGLVPGFGGTQRLLRLAGRPAALELCLLGQPIDAARAAALGIVTRVVPAAELEAETMKLAHQLAQAAPQALRGILDAVLVGGEAALDAGLAFETQVFAVTFGTEDMKEGTAAFLARRSPTFTGR
ncbi:MAG TPA: enoyl-CoA hydratase-related protein [Arenimonas sp.]|uniref:enoyl-CoA hydratase/isomerase family protein n=1 Tax=Arenimonas sp. TaxID=1872635 RepID=UPI002D7F68FB|nr:enoyl-CoA hydratase-related protein [Arenimonas sp.]HEU0153331.1 enoyl-CoA hydratase-related protein [Arenimonas sp.]